MAPSAPRRWWATRRSTPSTCSARGTLRVPDATGLELLAQDLREANADAVLDTLYFRDRGTLIIDPPAIREVLAFLRERGYTFLASVHGVDYYPDEPRLGVHYELLDMREVDR